MDILSRYEQQYPQEVSPALRRRPTQEYGIFVRLAMRVSGGRITNSRQASIALLGCAAMFVLAAIIIWPRTGQRIPSAAELREILGRLESFSPPF